MYAREEGVTMPNNKNNNNKKKVRKNGEGTLFKRKDGRYQASFVPENGKRKYVYGKTSDEALSKLRALQEEDRKGTLRIGPRQKLGDYLVQWLESTQKPPMSRPGTYVSYRSIMKKHLISGLGHIYLQKLTPQDIQNLYAQKIRSGLKPRTVEKIHAVLHKALSNAVRWNLVSTNVASLVSVPRPERYEGPVLTSSQARQLIETVKGNRMETILTLAITTGMRRGEILALRWIDIDFKNKVLYVRRTVNRLGGFGLVVNDPKTKTSRRKISLADFTIKALQEQRTRLEQVRLQAGDKWHEQGLVFPCANGGFIEPDYLYRQFQRMLNKIGFPRMRFHDLRHSAATILLVMGVPMKVVQELLGHSTMAMTADTYSHLLPSMQEDAAKRLDEEFNKKDNDNEEDNGETWSNNENWW
jgi:integrase